VSTRSAKPETVALPHPPRRRRGCPSVAAPGGRAERRARPRVPSPRDVSPMPLDAPATTATRPVREADGELTRTLSKRARTNPPDSGGQLQKLPGFPAGWMLESRVARSPSVPSTTHRRPPHPALRGPQAVVGGCSGQARRGSGHGGRRVGARVDAECAEDFRCGCRPWRFGEAGPRASKGRLGRFWGWTFTNGQPFLSSAVNPPSWFGQVCRGWETSLESVDLCGSASLPQLEREMADAREFVIRCRESGNHQSAQLHIVWIDLLVEEWNRCRMTDTVATNAGWRRDREVVERQ
jgi:hypothetical protein